MEGAEDPDAEMADYMAGDEAPAATAEEAEVPAEAEELQEDGGAGGMSAGWGRAKGGRSKRVPRAYGGSNNRRPLEPLLNISCY